MQYEYINEPEKFWKHSYLVCLHEFDSGVVVNADNEQDALDYAIDWAEDHNWMGYFIEEPTEEDYKTQITGGNHGLVLSSDNVTIKQLD